MSDIIRIPCGNVNAFLVKEKAHAVLVDTGLAGYAEKIYDVCKDSHVECIIMKIKCSLNLVLEKLAI